jgi:hypothetical protein
MKRLADRVAEVVTGTLEDLEIPGLVRDSIEWEVAPFMKMDPSTRGPVMAYMIGVGLPVPATGDSVMPFLPLDDAHDNDEIRRITQALFTGAQEETAKLQQKAVAAANGSKQSPGGLHLP